MLRNNADVRRCSYFELGLRVIRVLKMPRQRQQRGRQKSDGLNKQNNNSARAARFFVHFFAVTARLRRENA